MKKGLTHPYPAVSCTSLLSAVRRFTATGRTAISAGAPGDCGGPPVSEFADTSRWPSPPMDAGTSPLDPSPRVPDR